MSRKRKILMGGGITLLVAILAGVALASGGDRPLSVRSETVERRDLVATVISNGQIQPKRSVDISADISGRVIELRVEEGQWVERGDLLLRIDPTTYQAAVRRQEAGVAQARAQAAQARASLLQARQGLERTERLAANESLISAADLDDARTRVAVAEAQHEAARYGVETAQAALSEARDQLRKTTIVAPMSGRVTRLNIEEGETAIVGTMNNPGSLLLTIADLSVMEARVKVDETDVPRISFDDSATVRIDAYPAETFTGRVTRVSNSALRGTGSQQAPADGTSVDFEVVITLDDPPVDLRPDLSTTAEIVTARRDGVLSVPILALTVRTPTGMRLGGTDESEQEVEGVFVLRDGAARFVPVRVGIAGDRFFEILEGLEEGETVVSGTYQVIRELEDGRLVRGPAGPSRSSGGTGNRAAQEASG